MAPGSICGALSVLRCRLALVSHAFLGGAIADEIDRGWIRGTALRAAMRFWFRAVAGPLLRYEWANLAAVEPRLFGSVHGQTCTTFSMALEPGAGWHAYPDALLCPHSTQRGSAPAAEPGSEMTVSLKRRRPGFPGPTETGALAASLWLAANLGGVGKRARRGAGSLELCEWLDSDSFALPAGRSASLDQLRTRLVAGFTQARDLIRSDCGDCDAGRSGGRPAWFTIAGPDDIYLGTRAYRDQQVLRRDISAATHELKEQHGPKRYGAAMGEAGSNGRCASPLFVRISVTGADKETRYYPVLTWSRSRKTGSEEVVNAFLQRFDAESLTGERP